jgi:hypothetical protein
MTIGDGSSERLSLVWKAELVRVSPILPFVAVAGIKWHGLVMAVLVAVLVVVEALAISRSLVLTASGLSFDPLIPRPRLLYRTPIAWSGVDRFVVYTPFTFWRAPRRSFVRYLRDGDSPWRSITPVYATTDEGRALNAQDLCDLLNERLATFHHS